MQHFDTTCQAYDFLHLHRHHSCVLQLGGSDPEELINAQPIFAATRSKDKVLHLAPNRIHGSSTLNASRNAKGAEANWQAVNRFLALVNSQMRQSPPMAD